MLLESVSFNKKNRRKDYICKQKKNLKMRLKKDGHTKDGEENNSYSCKNKRLLCKTIANIFTFEEVNIALRAVKNERLYAKFKTYRPRKSSRLS